MKFVRIYTQYDLIFFFVDNDNNSTRKRPILIFEQADIVIKWDICLDNSNFLMRGIVIIFSKRALLDE